MRESGTLVQKLFSKFYAGDCDEDEVVNNDLSRCCPPTASSRVYCARDALKTASCGHWCL
ncbi:hypothetical protein OF001_U250042 [Pseudomonas sp. OF001]|nr:hypothetical protein OF001_U250042 [Pseudomonas sp. OF001]